MARMFNSNKVRSFFQKKKQILVDGCCDTETACCVVPQSCGFKVFYTVDNDPRTEISNFGSNPDFIGAITNGLFTTILFEVQSTLGTLDITSITTQASGPGTLNAFTTPVSVAENAFQEIVTFDGTSPLWTLGTFKYTITAVTSCGNIAISITIIV